MTETTIEKTDLAKEALYTKVNQMIAEVDADLTTEITNRTNADANLQTQIDNFSSITSYSLSGSYNDTENSIIFNADSTQTFEDGKFYNLTLEALDFDFVGDSATLEIKLSDGTSILFASSALDLEMALTMSYFRQTLGGYIVNILAQYTDRKLVIPSSINSGDFQTLSADVLTSTSTTKLSGTTTLYGTVNAASALSVTVPASSATNSALSTVAISKSSNGYVKLGNGLIIQYTSFSYPTASSWSFWTFPTPFTSFRKAVATMNSGDNPVYLNTTDNNLSGITVYSKSGGSDSYVYVIAIGY